MPYSLRDNDAVVASYVQNHGIKSVLDIGPGSGTYGRLLRPHVDTIIGIEAWEPYIKQFDLTNVYDAVIVGDVRTMPPVITHDDEENLFDLIIFGDVLEHMSAAESVYLWKKWAPRSARRGIISVPTVLWPQGHVRGNPFEEHVQDLVGADEYEEVLGPFDAAFSYPQTATFFREF